MDKEGKVSRCLFPARFQRLSDDCMEIIKKLEEEFDEIIIVITEAEKGYTPENPLSAAERVEKLSQVLRTQLTKPFYILPIKQNGLSEIQAVHRIKVSVPAFETVACQSAEAELLYRKVLSCKTLRVAAAEGKKSLYEQVKAVRRGLFLTRAQFFHNGHAAFVEQMLREFDEVIVVVAKADCSHTPRDPATCGERLEMIRPYLSRVAPDRFYLGAAPYEQYLAVNFYELLMMFPKFECVYGSNPAIIELARSTGLSVKGLNKAVKVSSSYVREQIIQGKPYEHLLPKEVSEVLRYSPALARLKNLNRPEKRGVLCAE